MKKLFEEVDSQPASFFDAAVDEKDEGALLRNLDLVNNINIWTVAPTEMSLEENMQESDEFLKPIGDRVVPVPVRVLMNCSLHGNPWMLSNEFVEAMGGCSWSFRPISYFASLEFRVYTLNFEQI